MMWGSKKYWVVSCTLLRNARQLWLYRSVLNVLCFGLLILYVLAYRNWREIVKRFIPIGICLVAVVQWRAFRRSETPANEWVVKLYCTLPLRAFSRTWGHIAGKFKFFILNRFSSIFSLQKRQYLNSYARLFTGCTRLGFMSI